MNEQCGHSLSGFGVCPGRGVGTLAEPVTWPGGAVGTWYGVVD